MRPTPPTIADLQSQGVRAARAFCLNQNCAHCGVVLFDALPNAAEVPFIRLARSRRFVWSHARLAAVSCEHLLVGS